MGHDHGSYQSPGDSPGGSPCEVFFLVLSEELDLEGFGEVLSQVVGGSHLHRLAVRHHCFEGCSVDCALELLPLRLLTHENRYGDLIFDESPVNFEDCHNLFFSFLLSSMNGVAFLPEELCRADEGLGRSDLSPYDRALDVDENRQGPPT